MEPFASVLRSVWEAVWTVSGHSVTFTKHAQASADCTCSRPWGASFSASFSESATGASKSTQMCLKRCTRTQKQPKRHPTAPPTRQDKCTFGKQMEPFAVFLAKFHSISSKSQLPTSKVSQRVPTKPKSVPQKASGASKFIGFS